MVEVIIGMSFVMGFSVGFGVCMQVGIRKTMLRIETIKHEFDFVYKEMVDKFNNMEQYKSDVSGQIYQLEAIVHSIAPTKRTYQ